jgi:hypothetical protein
MPEEYTAEKRKEKDSPRRGNGEKAREGSSEINDREESREDKPIELDRNASGQSSTVENDQRRLNTGGWRVHGLCQNVQSDQTSARSNLLVPVQPKEHNLWLN